MITKEAFETAFAAQKDAPTRLQNGGGVLENHYGQIFSMEEVLSYDQVNGFIFLKDEANNKIWAIELSAPFYETDWHLNLFKERIELFAYWYIDPQTRITELRKFAARLPAIADTPECHRRRAFKHDLRAQR